MPSPAANNHTRQFTYNAADQQVQALDGLSQAAGWDYDASERVVTQHDPRGSSYDLQFSYDGMDRLIKASSTNLTVPIQAQYDALGRRTVLTDTSGTTNFGYDALGRLNPILNVYNALGQRIQNKKQVLKRRCSR